MPAWKDTLSSQQIWTLALLLKHMDKLSPGGCGDVAAGEELSRLLHTTAFSKAGRREFREPYVVIMLSPNACRAAVALVSRAIFLRVPPAL